MLYVKILFWLVILVTAALFVSIVLTGRDMRRRGRSEANIRRHRLLVDVTLVSTTIAIVLVEGMAHIPALGAQPIDPTLMKLHLFFAVSFVVVFLSLRMRFTGVRYPRVHRWLPYVAAFCLAVAAPTGLYMSYQS